MKVFLSVGRSVLIVGLLLLSHQVNAETPDEWIALGARVHNGFGALVAVGVKIGLDAVKRLNAGPGDLKVTYYDGDKSPCACAADGIAIATYSSVGQRNLISLLNRRRTKRLLSLSSGPRTAALASNTQFRYPR